MSKRQIVLDTETTGLSPKQGHRIIEIAAVELIDRVLTGNNYHCYLNPQRPIDPGAQKVHGITFEFLQDKPLFCEQAAAFCDFVSGCGLIIHNAPFDVGFLDAELDALDLGFAPMRELCDVIDTLPMARQKHPGQRNTLDALCQRYKINASHRTLHGALLDARLLAQVYLAMSGTQEGLFDAKTADESSAGIATARLPAFNLPVWLANEQECQTDNAYKDWLLKQKAVAR